MKENRIELNRIEEELPNRNTKEPTMAEACYSADRMFLALLVGTNNNEGKFNESFLLPTIPYKRVTGLYKILNEEGFVVAIRKETFIEYIEDKKRSALIHERLYSLAEINGLDLQTETVNNDCEHYYLNATMMTKERKEKEQTKLILK